MKIYGNVQIAEGSDIINAVVQAGTSDDSTPQVGELFYRSDLKALRVYDGSYWHSQAALDAPQTFTSAVVTHPVDLPISSGMITLDALASNVFTISQSNDISAWSIANEQDGQVIRIVFIEVVGGHSIVWPSNFYFIGSSTIDNTTGHYNVLIAQYVSALSGWICTLDTGIVGAVTSVSGTTDQVIASSTTGAITLSLPQSIATTSSPTFADITATGSLTAGGVVINGMTINNTTTTGSFTTGVSQTIDSFSISAYRSVKYHVQVTASSAYHCVEMLIVHDGTTAYKTEYAIVVTSGTLGTFDAVISAGNLQLKLTPQTTDTYTVQVARFLLQA